MRDRQRTGLMASLRRISHQDRSSSLLPSSARDWRRKTTVSQRGRRPPQAPLFRRRIFGRDVARRKGARRSFGIGTAGQSVQDRSRRDRFLQRAEHGTATFGLVVRQRLPVGRRSEILSARFLHDPRFVVRVNQPVVSLPDSPCLSNEALLDIRAAEAEENVVNTTRDIHYQGVAFWLNGRRGDPGWIVGERGGPGRQVEFAKRYTVVVKVADEWITGWRPTGPDSGRAADGGALLVGPHATGGIEGSPPPWWMSSRTSLAGTREQFKQLSPLSRGQVAKFHRTRAQQPSSRSSPRPLQALINRKNRGRGRAPRRRSWTGPISRARRALSVGGPCAPCPSLTRYDHRLAASYRHRETVGTRYGRTAHASSIGPGSWPGVRQQRIRIEHHASDAAESSSAEGFTEAFANPGSGPTSPAWPTPPVRCRQCVRPGSEASLHASRASSLSS